MPDLRLQKARESLPADYRFGDAGKPAIRIRFLLAYDIHAPEAAKELRAVHEATQNENPCR